jgi:hypothetical protein
VPKLKQNREIEGNEELAGGKEGLLVLILDNYIASLSTTIELCLRRSVQGLEFL